MARHARLLLGLGGVGALVALALSPNVACNGSEECPGQWKCANNGMWFCDYVPATYVEIDPACCPEPPPASATDGGHGGAATPDSGAPAATPANDGGEAAAQNDGGEVAAAADAGEVCDGGVFPWNSDGGRPQGRDERGIAYIYKCGFDICHPFANLPVPDAGNCGPFACQ